MATWHFEDLNITSKQIRAAVGFLEAYADTCLRELSSEGTGGVQSEIELSNDRDWAIAVDAASALREGGQWALLIDVPYGRGLLDRAADLFVMLQHGFGYFLKVAVSFWGNDPPASFYEAVQYLSSGSANSPTPSPLQHPQQQAYLLLAATASTPVAREFRDTLREVVVTSPHRRGVVPVGALGTPIHRYWAIAEAMLRDENGPAAIADHVAAIGRQYRETIQLAGVNEYLWRHAAAPVDIVDIDIIGVVILAVRHFGRRDVEKALESRRFGEDAREAIQMDIALQLAHH